MSIPLRNITGSVVNGKTQIAQRDFGTTSNETSNPKKVAFINGIRGQLAPEMTLKLIESGYKVIGFSREVKDLAQTKRFTPIKTSSDLIKDEKFWANVIHKYVNDDSEGPADEVLFVNTVGASTATNGQSLADINEKPVLAAAKGMEKAAAQSKAKMNFVHISSIAASILGNDHPYSEVRERADQRLMTEVKAFPVLSLRPGLVFNPMTLTGKIDMGHSYSPEQIAALSGVLLGRVCVLGSGKQIQQPVASSDMVNAVLGGAKQEESKIVVAVGPDAITQEEMFKFFQQLRGKSFKPLYIPIETAKMLAENFPLGRFASYAMNMFGKLENPEHNKAFPTEEFRQLAGGELKSMKEEYKAGDTPLVYSRPPLLQHGKNVVKKLASCAECRKTSKEAFKILLKSSFKTDVNNKK